MPVKVFISWSGSLSQGLAKELRKWLPSVLQFTKPYFTPDDVEKGARWFGEISGELCEAQIGVICLTRDNLNSPWILFESGALSKNVEKSKICPILFGLDNSAISGPLAALQATKFEKEDFRKLVVSINASSPDDVRLEKDVLNEVFDMWWPKLKASVENILASAPTAESEITVQRTEKDILEEVLQLTRLTSKTNSHKSGTRHALKRFLMELDEFMHFAYRGENKEIIIGAEMLYPAIRNLCIELDCEDMLQHFSSIEKYLRHH